MEAFIYPVSDGPSRSNVNKLVSHSLTRAHVYICFSLALVSWLKQVCVYKYARKSKVRIQITPEKNVILLDICRNCTTRTVHVLDMLEKNWKVEFNKMDCFVLDLIFHYFGKFTQSMTIQLLDLLMITMQFLQLTGFMKAC